MIRRFSYIVTAIVAMFAMACQTDVEVLPSTGDGTPEGWTKIEFKADTPIMTEVVVRGADPDGIDVQNLTLFCFNDFGLYIAHVEAELSPAIETPSLSGTYTGSMIVPHYAGYIENDRMEVTPDFLDLNFKVAYTFVLRDHMNLEVNAGVQNILDSFQGDLDKGEFRDSGYFYGPTQPRTFFVGMKISR